MEFIPPMAQPTPQPQQSSYSTESKMQPMDAPNGAYRVQLLLDEESIKLLQQVSPVFTDAIINAGIKMMAKTNVFKEYMLKQEHKTKDTSTEDLSTSVSIQDITTQVTQASTVVPNNAVGFGKSPIVSNATPLTPGTQEVAGFKSW